MSSLRVSVGGVRCEGGWLDGQVCGSARARVGGEAGGSDVRRGASVPARAKTMQRQKLSSNFNGLCKIPSF